MAAYAVYLNIDLLDVVPKRGPQRRQIMDFVLSLGAEPSTEGDYTEKDETLRIRQVKIISDYAITYWADHAVKTVMIADIRRADL
jgi:anti-sigma factor RsiW